MSEVATKLSHVFVLAKALSYSCAISSIELKKGRPLWK